MLVRTHLAPVEWRFSPLWRQFLVVAPRSFFVLPHFDPKARRNGLQSCLKLLRSGSIALASRRSEEKVPPGKQHWRQNEIELPKSEEELWLFDLDLPRFERATRTNEGGSARGNSLGHCPLGQYRIAGPILVRNPSAHLSTRDSPAERGPAHTPASSRGPERTLVLPMPWWRVPKDWPSLASS